uniref:phenylalanine--tRNA ligase n=1 Tax=Angiostrongylus cantonensis TaxID=6313 RepID=A0A0K0DHX8_ANGCA
MPTIAIRKPLLDKHLGRVYCTFPSSLAHIFEIIITCQSTEKEFDELCFDYGLELDEVTSEKATLEKERGHAATSDEPCDFEVYKIEVPANRYDLVCVEGLTRALHNYASFIDLQDKLHQNICRKRTLVAIGTHDLNTISGPFKYTADYPKNIRFIPLNQNKEFTAAELMEFYSADSHLKPYLPIIRDKERYPVIYDANGVAIIVLDTVVVMFSQYSRERFTIEPVEVVYEKDNRKEALKSRELMVRVSEINTKIGFQLDSETMAELLGRMSLEANVITENTLKVTIPPSRHDILHECDIAEDVGVAYGYNKLVRRLPESNTVAKAFPLNKLSDLLRGEVAATGWTEALNFALCSREDISTRLRDEKALENAVHISNPKTQEFQVARSSLLPGLMKTLLSNHVGARNERRLAAVFYNKTAGFEIIHGFLDRVMRLLDINPSKNGDGYYIRSCDNPTFFPGRCASIVGPRNSVLGVLAMLSDCLLIIAIALCTALAGEGLTYLLVYRSEQYKRLKSEMERKTKRLEKKKQEVGDAATNRDMSMFKMKSMFAIGLAFTALLSTFNSIFDGRVVARLPFVPIGFLQGLSHRNLNLQKALGFAPSRAMNRQQGSWAPTQQQQFNYFR